MDINDWRIEIDRLDEQLVELLNRRSQCAIEIGRIKRAAGLPVYSPSRETQVIENVTRHNNGPLSDDAIRRLFERIIDEARRVERLAIGEHDHAPETAINKEKLADQTVDQTQIVDEAQTVDEAHTAASGPDNNSTEVK